MARRASRQRGGKGRGQKSGRREETMWQGTRRASSKGMGQGGEGGKIRAGGEEKVAREQVRLKVRKERGKRTGGRYRS